MKKGYVLLAALLAILVASAAYAVETAQPAAPAANAQADQQKQAVIANFSALQNREVRVVILQQLIEREAQELKKMEAAFCENYKLDVEKWRRGEYRYDEKLGKFVENKTK